MLGYKYLYNLQTNTLSLWRQAVDDILYEGPATAIHDKHHLNELDRLIREFCWWIFVLNQRREEDEEEDEEEEEEEDEEEDEDTQKGS